MSFVDTQDLILSGSAAERTLDQMGSAVSLGKAIASGPTADAVGEAIEVLQNQSSDVQQMLAFELRLAPDLPENLIVTIATNDDASVSVPFLETSPAVTEGLILSIVDELNGSAQSAVARRPDVSDAVAGALVERGNNKVALCLARNDKAIISDDVLERIVAKFPNDARILKSTDAARSRITKTQTAEPSSTELPFNVLTSRARAFRKNGMLTADYMVDLLQQGALNEFEASLCALTGHTRKDVRALVLHSAETLAGLEKLCQLEAGTLLTQQALIKACYATLS